MYIDTRVLSTNCWQESGGEEEWDGKGKKEKKMKKIPRTGKMKTKWKGEKMDKIRERKLEEKKLENGK